MKSPQQPFNLFVSGGNPRNHNQLFENAPEAGVSLHSPEANEGR
ncbi:MAG: hypothetical protein ACKVOU_09545 [Cytophagales bacterium]